MAGTTKRFDLVDDITQIKTQLYEAIPITGSIVSGTYAAADGTGTDSNIKNYTHGLFQSAYDYPYASSSANQIFDTTVGYSTYSVLSGATGAVIESSKNNIYNEMAQFLVGFDNTGSIERFDSDGDLTGGPKFDEIIVLNLTRLLTKDGLQKGTFELEMGVSGSDAGYLAPFTETIKIKDLNGTSSFRVDSPKGEFGILYANNSQGTPLNGVGMTATAVDAPCGLLYYQAGVAVLSASMFMPTANGGLMSGSSNNMIWNSGSAYSWDIHETLVSSSISGACDGFRRRFYNLAFNNTTILNSTNYKCLIRSRDFNYSSNPTYLDGSKIRVKGDDANNLPKTYFTTVGLYNAQDQLLAVAKLSKAIANSPTEDLLIKVRLDY